MSMFRKNLAGAALLAMIAGTAMGQAAPVPSHRVGIQANSGAVFADAGDGNDAKLVYMTDVTVPNASWLRLKFDEVVLAGDVTNGTGSYLVITSMFDGAKQVLDAKSVEEWYNTSAYMNGDTVIVELWAYPGTGENRLVMNEVTSGDPVPGGLESICGATDDRTALNDPRAGRIMPVGCTGWLITENGDANEFLTAGHCMSAGQGGLVQQFNVPLSSSGGVTVNPPPQFQFPIISTSIQSSGNAGIGNDWARYNTSANSNTGLHARVAMYGSAYIVATTAPAGAGITTTVQGYGTTSGTQGVPLNQSQFGKVHSGPSVAKSGTNIRYTVDTTGGNSGSPVTQIVGSPIGFTQAIGIHTHAGCSNVAGTFNNGTAIEHAGLQNALNNPNAGGVGYSALSSRGTIFDVNNGGSTGGAMYFDLETGPNDLEVNAMRMNLGQTTAQYTFDVYLTKDTSVGKETNSSHWTKVASGGGNVNPENTPSPATLFNTFDLKANSKYGVAIVLQGANHQYTDGTGTNQTYSNADMTLNLGSASNTPWGSNITPRVWNGTFYYYTDSTPMCTITEVPSMTVASAKIDFDSFAAGSQPTFSTMNSAATPLPAILTSLNGVIAEVNGGSAGVYNTNTAFGRAYGRDGVQKVISNNGSAPFEAANYRIQFSRDVTEFGFRVGDWLGPVKVTFYDDELPVGSATSASEQAFFQMSGCDFDEVLLEVDAIGNFVITELWTEAAECYEEIGSMTAPFAEVDFDSFAANATPTVAQINAAGTPNDAIISAINTPTKVTALAGMYDTNTSFGRAYARQSSVKKVISNASGTAFDATTFEVVFDKHVSEFGVEVGDYTGGIVVNFYDGATLLGTVTSTSQSAKGAKFFGKSGSECPEFNRVTIDVNNTAGNFVLTELWTEGAVACYADCDKSGSLDFFDFLCFQNEFAAKTAYADCDGSGSHDFFDFLCFQNEFAAGCK